MKPAPGVRETLIQIAAGKLSAEAATRACLERVSAREPAVQAWAFLDPERALGEARMRDRATVKGPLHGLPIAIKDVLDTADMPTGYGSPIYQGHQPASDAACVALLRAAGAVVLGKTVTTEFAMAYAGKTRHPLNPAHTPGGSSSGSAAAVADGMVPAALGTQTLGSVIRPAAYCGVVGFKPTYGAINRGGMKIASESADTIGLFAREVADLPPLLSAQTGAPLDSYDKVAEGHLRVGLCRGIDWEKATPAGIEAFENAAKRLEQAGARLHDVAIPPELKAAHDYCDIVTGYEMARAYAWEWFNHRDRLSDKLRAGIERGFNITFANYIAMRGQVELTRRVMADSFNDADFWLTLPAPGEAPDGLEYTGDPVFNRAWTIVHVPALTLPCGAGPAGLPLGVQLIGPPRGAARLLACARWAERALRP